MLILLPPALLLIGAAALTALPLLRPKFRFGWLVALTAVLIAALVVLIQNSQIPDVLALPVWTPTVFSSTPPTLSQIDLTWPYALCIAAVALSSLLTAPARAGFPRSASWAPILGFAGLGILAVSADNALTLVLIWAALDLVELGFSLRSSDLPTSAGQAVFAFSARVGSLILVLLAQVLPTAGAPEVGFAAVAAPHGLLLLVASLIRLAAFAAPAHVDSAAPGAQSVEATMQLISACAAIAFLSRLQSSSLSSPFSPVLWLLLAATALYAGWMWLRAPDDMVGRPYWILGVATLALASVSRGDPVGATGWGLCLLLVGGALFLSSARQTWITRSLWIGVWTMSSLPFSLTATAWLGKAGMLDWSLPLLLVAQAALLAGFLFHAQRSVGRLPLGQEPPWLRAVYPIGIDILLGLQVLLGLWAWKGATSTGAWLGGVIAVVFGLVIVWLKRRVPRLSPTIDQWLPSPSAGPMGRLLAVTHALQAVLRSLVDTITALFEGEAGIMWSLLILALFVSVIVSRKP
jgi:hypothetical protein